VVYIAVIVLVINLGTPYVQKETLVIPIAMLSLLVLSVAMMAFIFFYEPLQLLMVDRKSEALSFFLKTLGFFTAFVVVLGILVLLTSSS
jgi:hypothetical protein